MALTGTSKFTLYEQFFFTCRFELYALFIKWKITALLIKVICIIYILVLLVVYVYVALEDYTRIRPMTSFSCILFIDVVKGIQAFSVRC